MEIEGQEEGVVVVVVVVEEEGGEENEGDEEKFRVVVRELAFVDCDKVALVLVLAA